MKRFLIILGLICVCILVSALSRIYENKPLQSFSIEEYSEVIQEYSYDYSFGEITSASEAKKYAEKLWLELYGLDVICEKPYCVSFDPEADVWLVEGDIPEGVFGGVAKILIQKSTGNVIAVWHER